MVRHENGFSLVELMVSLLIGLLLAIGAMNIFISNAQTYRTVETLGRMQENVRIAFELMAREIRSAGGNLCGISSSRVANVLNNSTSYWWADWAGSPIKGYSGDEDGPKSFGTSTASRIQGTEAITILSGALSNDVMITDHNPTSAQFKVNTTSHGISDGDILMACDSSGAAIFQVTQASSTNVTIVHNTGTGTPGNCSKGLGFPTVCTTNGTSKTFEGGGMLTKLTAVHWYVGKNANGGKSLYRMATVGSTSPTNNEIAANVANLQFGYLVDNGTDYVSAASVTDWKTVRAVRFTLTVVSDARVDITQTNKQTVTLQRTYTAVVTLRSS